MSDFYDYYPEEIRQDVKDIIESCKSGLNNAVTDNKKMNRLLVEYFIRNGEQLGLPHQCKCAITDELQEYLAYWPEDLRNQRLQFGYVISSYEGGAGPALIAPDGGWIGAVNWDFAQRLRAAWVEQESKR